MASDEILFDGPTGSLLTLVLAHGAGGPMDSAFLTTVAKSIAGRGFRVARFEFAYMRARPFHPPGKPERLRTAHLADLKTPALIVQGERDPFGPREEVESYRLSPSIRLVWIAAGDHSFKPPAKSGRTEAGNVAEAVVAVADFLTARV